MRISNFLPSLPMRVKVVFAKLFIRMMSVDNLDNDIVLYNELRKWIETKGRPFTSDPAYWLGKSQQEKEK